MKKMLIVLLSVAILSFPVPGHSQAGFLLGVGAGALFFGGDDGASGSGVALIYVAPKSLLNRVKNPFAARFSGVILYNSGVTLEQLFSASLPDDQKGKDKDYEILQIVRIVDGQASKRVAFWFIYIEKRSLAPPEIPGPGK